MPDTQNESTITKDSQQVNTATKRNRRARKNTTNQKPPLSESISGPGSSGNEEKDTPPKTRISWRVSEKRAKALQENIAGVYATAGIFVASRNQYDGLVLISGAYDRASEVTSWASHNKRTFELLERLFQQSDFVKMLVGHGAMVYAILQNHDKAPKNPTLLQQFGYLPEQLYAKFSPNTTESTASTPNGSSEPTNAFSVPV